MDYYTKGMFLFLLKINFNDTIKDINMISKVPILIGQQTKHDKNKIKADKSRIKTINPYHHN